MSLSQLHYLKKTSKKALNNLFKKYSKPITLSDPYSDWNGDIRLTDIINKSSNSLDKEDFWVIYYKLPAATYEEGCYYIKFFVAELLNGLDLRTSLEGFITFIALNIPQFENENAFNPLQECLVEILFKIVNTNPYTKEYFEMILDSIVEYPIFVNMYESLKQKFETKNPDFTEIFLMLSEYTDLSFSRGLLEENIKYFFNDSTTAYFYACL